METVSRMPNKKRNKMFSQITAPDQRNRKSSRLYQRVREFYALIPLVVGI